MENSQKMDEYHYVSFHGTSPKKMMMFVGKYVTSVYFHGKSTV